MKALAGGLLLSLACRIPLVAQERDRSIERVTLVLQHPHPIMSGVDPAETAVPKTLGILTLVPPELKGEIVRVSIPIGELVSRAFKGVAAAKQQRQEKVARRRVEADLKGFAAQPSTQR